MFLKCSKSFTWFRKVKKELNMYCAFLSLLELAVDVDST